MQLKSGVRFFFNGVGTQMMTAEHSQTREKSFVAEKFFDFSAAKIRLAEIWRM